MVLAPVFGLREEPDLKVLPAVLLLGLLISRRDDEIIYNDHVVLLGVGLLHWQDILVVSFHHIWQRPKERESIGRP